MPIEQFGKGAIPDTPDPRDFKFEDVMGAAHVDWLRPFQLPHPPANDQGPSDSCVAQAWSYYHWQLHGKNYSRRDLFCRIALEYGAQIRDGGWQVVNNGQATRDEVPDPSPETMQNMRDKTGVTPQAEASDKESNYFVIQDGSIDGIALAIEQFKGVVFGVIGTNQGWQDYANPRPPQQGETQWGHALYALGHHMHDGLKCILAMPSWPGVEVHHIKENYFASGNTFNAWTLIPAQGQNMQLVNDKGTVFLITGNKDKRKIGIADLNSLGLFGDEPQVLMDTSDIPEYNTIVDAKTITHKPNQPVDN
jgi:hypothetical protein